MYATEVFMKNSCTVVNANIIATKGITAKAEKDGKVYDACYDTDHKMFVVDDVTRTDSK